jgi:hypothetical protein
VVVLAVSSWSLSRADKYVADSGCEAPTGQSSDGDIFISGSEIQSGLISNSDICVAIGKTKERLIAYCGVECIIADR